MKRVLVSGICLAGLVGLVACGSDVDGGIDKETPTPTPLPPIEIEALSPDPGSDNVAVRDPISVTFSAPLPDRVLDDPSKVVLVDSKGQQLSVSLDLSEDSKTLHIQPITTPSVPNILTLDIRSALDGLFGGADELSSPTNYWELPLWYQMGDPEEKIGQRVLGAKVAMDQSDNPVTVKWFFNGTTVEILAHRFTGMAWEQLGNQIETAPGDIVWDPFVAVDRANRPVVAWTEWNPNVPKHGNVYVRRFVQGAWQNIGGALNIDDAVVRGLAIDGVTNQPVVAFTQGPSGQNNVTPVVMRWDDIAGQWIPLNGVPKFVDSQPVLAMSIAVDGSDVYALIEQDTVAYGRHLFLSTWRGAGPWGAYSGTSVVVDGTIGSVLSGSAIAIAPDHTPYVVVSTNGTRPVGDPNTDVKVFRYDAGWKPVGGTLDRGLNNVAVVPSLAFDSGGAPVVSWREDSVNNDNRNVYVSRWNPSAQNWDRIGDSLEREAGNMAFNPSVAVGSDDTIHVAWTNQHSSKFNENCVFTATIECSASISRFNQ